MHPVVDYFWIFGWLWESMTLIELLLKSISLRLATLPPN
jgi:hypothetical protein